jgi:hypothetical protein
MDGEERGVRKNLQRRKAPARPVNRMPCKKEEKEKKKSPSNIPSTNLPSKEKIKAK